MYLDAKRERPVKDGPRSTCPECGGEVIPKCGGIKIWHWAHKHVGDCEMEGETDWHLAWKDKLYQMGAEIEKKIGTKRADAVLDGVIYEFQHSPISEDEIQEREENAKENGYKIKWLRDAHNAEFDLDEYHRIEPKYYKWKGARKNTISKFPEPWFVDHGQVFAIYNVRPNRTFRLVECNLTDEFIPTEDKLHRALFIDDIDSATQCFMQGMQWKGETFRERLGNQIEAINQFKQLWREAH